VFSELIVTPCFNYVEPKDKKEKKVMCLFVKMEVLANVTGE